MRWRVIPLSINTASENMAMDSAILDQVISNNSPPTLRIYRWKPSAVSVGYFQSVSEEINIQMCRKKGIDIVRRITGGGAVYHDFNGEITYSIILPEKYDQIPKDIILSYEKICGGIIYGLNNLGLNAEFKPINDILVNQKKISGNAQTRKKKVILQHGTILMDININKMFSYLNVDKIKISDKMIKSVKDRVTSIKNELKEKINFNKISDLLIKGFSKKLNFEYDLGILSSDEKRLVKFCQGEKFSNKDWIFKR